MNGRAPCLGSDRKTSPGRKQKDQALLSTLPQMPNILLTNDDGYQAEGLRALAAALEGFATVSIVAPSREQSGAAQSLTLRQPIVCNQIAEREWAIDGTPADCVIGA